MKLLLYSVVAATLVLSSCSSAYKSTQTPDDVYNSPSATTTSRNTDNGSTNTTADDGSNYVTYDDGSQYDSDYGRRMNMFSGSYVSGNYSDYYYAPVGISAYYGSPYYSYYPYSGFGWGLGFGLGFGYSSFYYPWYSPYYGYGYGYGYPYYYGGGGYYHGGYYGGSHGGYYSNPVNRIRTNGAPTAGNGFTNNGGFTGGRTRTGVVPSNNNTGVSNNRRVFTPSSSEQSGYSRPTRSFSQPTFQAPTRSFSQPSYSAPRTSGFSGGGGGFSGGGRRR
ncbi:hypothetical protein GA0116948_109160 [Chitinophaga costaii]|uniref:Vitellogenin II n=1 Tax=Chitinophaga costaii TaxID=1335309 RepID=A0A1C4ESB3_9BACT|nr:hypothetical protein [Chitinophaga costaii]PUZ22561.1 hypothetical protein DCM91_14940 [Chitinophaga costaii]SCC46490.1 hypothetical protein GA0116948_109160 [Chitinophaga costaii]